LQWTGTAKLIVNATSSVDFYNFHCMNMYPYTHTTKNLTTKLTKNANFIVQRVSIFIAGLPCRPALTDKGGMSRLRGHRKVKLWGMLNVAKR